MKHSGIMDIIFIVICVTLIPANGILFGDDFLPPSDSFQNILTDELPVPSSPLRYHLNVESFSSRGLIRATPFIQPIFAAPIVPPQHHLNVFPTFSHHRDQNPPISNDLMKRTQFIQPIIQEQNLIPSSPLTSYQNRIISPAVVQSYSPPVTVQSYSPTVVETFSPPAVPAYSPPVVQSYSVPFVQRYSSPVVPSYSPPVSQSYSPPVSQSYSPPLSQSYSLPVAQSYSSPQAHSRAVKSSLVLATPGPSSILGKLLQEQAKYTTPQLTTSTYIAPQAHNHNAHRRPTPVQHTFAYNQPVQTKQADGYHYQRP